MIATTSRHARVEQARQTALPRKPIPVLLLLARAYRDGWDGTGSDGSINFGPGVDRTSAMERLRRKLDAAEPADFAWVVAKWAADHQARWVG
jgi:hypothetical protein